MLLDSANEGLRLVHTHKSAVLSFEPQEAFYTTMSRYGQASDAFRSLWNRNVPLARAGLAEEQQHPRQTVSFYVFYDINTLIQKIQPLLTIQLWWWFPRNFEWVYSVALECPQLVSSQAMRKTTRLAII